MFVQVRLQLLLVGMLKIQAHLTQAGAAVLGEQHGLHDRLGDLVLILGHGHGDTERLPDLFRLAQDYLEDGAVHRIVLAVDHQGADSGRALAEPVHAALALLVAGRVPGQVVVNGGVEEFLQVDALGEAVGGHHEAWLVAITQGVDLFFPLGGVQLAGDAEHFVLLEKAPQGLGHIMGGGDIAAEDHWAETFFGELLELGDQVLEFRVVLVGEPVHLLEQALQVSLVFLKHGTGLNIVRRETGVRGTVEHCSFAGGFQFFQLFFLRQFRSVAGFTHGTL